MNKTIFIKSLMILNIVRILEKNGNEQLNTRNIRMDIKTTYVIQHVHT